MPAPRSVLFSLCVLLVALALGACQPVQAPAGSAPAMTEESAATEEATEEASAEGAAASITGLNEVTVTAVEYGFTAPESVPAGWTRFTLDNQGELAHDFMLFQVEEGRTMDEVMASLEAEGPPEWAEFFGAVTAEGGNRKWFAANLEPGPYVYLSFGASEEGPPDAAQGMIGSMTVTEAAEPGADDAAIEAAMQADANIEMVDYQFIVGGTIAAGEQVLRVSNTGVELHEVIFFKLNEGSSLADFQAVLEREMAGEMVEDSAIPGEFVGSTYLSPGRVSYTTQEFESGDYVLICFVPSPANEMQPHAALGMVQQITVE